MYDLTDPHRRSLSKVIAIATALNATPENPELATQTFVGYVADGADPVDLLTGA